MLINLSLSVQLKPGGRIPVKGKKITVCVKNVNDLSRDVIKVCYYSFKTSCMCNAIKTCLCSLVFHLALVCNSDLIL